MGSFFAVYMIFFTGFLLAFQALCPRRPRQAGFLLAWQLQAITEGFASVNHRRSAEADSAIVEQIWYRRSCQDLYSDLSLAIPHLDPHLAPADHLGLVELCMDTLDRSSSGPRTGSSPPPSPAS